MNRYIYVVLLSSLFFLLPNRIIAMNLDSIEQVTLQMLDTEKKVDNLLILGEALHRINQKKSLKYTYQAQKIIEKLAYKAGQKQLYFNLGIFLISSNGDSANHYLDLALNLAEESQEEYLISKIYNAKGSILYNRNKRKEALLLYYKAEKYAHSSNNITLLPDIYNNIGIVHAHSSNENAMTYFRKAYYNTNSKGMESQRLRATINLGTSLKEDNQLDSSLFFLHEALSLNEIVKNKYFYVNIYFNISMIYSEKEDLNKMKEYALKSLDAAKEMNYSYNLMKGYQILQRAEVRLGNYQKAIEYGEFALKSSGRIRTPDDQMIVYTLQSKAYRALGNNAKALIYQDTVLIYRDSIQKLEQQENIQELEKKYNLEKLEKQQLAQAKQARLERGILYSVLGLLILISFGAIRFYRISKAKTKLSKQLEAQTIELEQLDETKTRFFTNVSHELKTPLTLIINPIQKLLQDVNIDKESFFLLKTVQKHSYQLLDITNQILELTRFDKNTIELNKTVVNPYQLIQLTFSEFESFAVSKHLDFTLQNNFSEELFISTDKYKLQTIIKNLITNAIKFTPKGGTIQLISIEKENSIEIIVVDTGRGVSESQVSKIFDRYYQVTSSNRISEGGTGIGLAICKEYVEALDGEIEVNSIWQEGTTFRVVLPKVKVDKPVFLQPKKQLIKDFSPIIITEEIDKKNDLPMILLVEDNVDMQQYLQHVLSPSFNIHISNNGQEALEYMGNNQPQLIISDVMMPIMNGYEFLETCKKEPKWASIPFIMLTAVSETTEKLKFLRLGIDDYLTKPFVDDELIARIDNLLENLEERKSYKKEIFEDQEEKENATQEITLTEEEQRWLQEVEKNVKKSCGRFDFSVDMLAHDLFLSRSQIHRRIKILTGLTPKVYINNIRFSIARELLQKDSLITIKAVALKVGFKDEKYFSRKFKQYFGKNPSEYSA
jgi:signal transduction histidine kinase/DNA-binding response OmpR family regulator